jgi:hypothetical protein
MSETNANKLRIARALAIEAYAALEWALVVLFARLLDTTNDKAAIIFFKITNANARNEILGGLLEETHQSKYHTYWHGQAGAQGQKKITGLLALIPQLDQQRNFIVHWHQSSTVTSAGEKWDDLRLPYYWVRGPHRQPITVPALEEFRFKAAFVQLSIFYFTQFTSKSSDVFLRAYGGELATWTRIFEQPVPYPPASNHPLVQKTKEHLAPPRSSRT